MPILTQKRLRANAFDSLDSAYPYLDTLETLLIHHGVLDRTELLRLVRTVRAEVLAAQSFLKLTTREIKKELQG